MTTKPKIYFEVANGTFHCEAANGNDYTLCGYTLDGDLGETPRVEGHAVKITCPTCAGIIRFCRSLSLRAVAITAGDHDAR